METANRRLTAMGMSSLPGYKKGGAIRCMAGGAIKGKGTGTSDDIPIMASNGEFMIKAKAAKKIGIEVLEALNTIADKPDEKDSKAEAAREYGDAEGNAEDKAEGPKGEKKEGFKSGGAVRKMADGGLLEKEGTTISKTGREIPNAPGTNAALADQTAAYAAGAQAANPPRPPATLAPIVPGPPTPPAPAAQDQGPTYGDQMSNVAGFFGNGASRILKTIVSAPGYGFNAPSAPVQPPAAETKLAPIVPAQPAPTNVIPQEPVPARPAAAKQVMSATPAPAAPAPAGQVVRDGNSYSGNNVAGNVSFVDPKGQPAPARGGFVSGTGDGSFAFGGGATGGDAALSAARMAAIQRGDIDAVRASYGGDFGGKTAADSPIDALMNNGRPMTARKAAAIAQLQAQKEAGIQGGAVRKLAASKDAREATGSNLDNASKKQLQDAKNALINAKTPDERLAATDRLRALQEKYEKELPAPRLIVVPGAKDKEGGQDRSSLYDPDTKTWIQPPGSTLMQPQTAHIAALKANPQLAADFDAKFGPEAAAKALGQK